MIEDRLNRVLAGISHTGYTTELERYEARKLLKEQNKEIERLNNIINALEKLITDEEKTFGKPVYIKSTTILNRLKELKESDNNE